jgi:dihydrofolate synthase/folylpolyglutamate synthase
MTLGLANIKRLLGAVGDPHERFKSILVAGTNGKGTVTACLAALLDAAGHRTGRFISPHVYDATERIAIGNEPISLEEMERAAARVAPLRGEIEFSYFEALTAVAFLVFAERKVEYAVLEVGLGGRFDATNVVDPELSILTGIGLDHRKILGDTQEEILREKLGITRPGRILLHGELPDSLRNLVAEKAQRDGFRSLDARELGTVHPREVTFAGIRMDITTGGGRYRDLSAPFPGRHQAANVLLALVAAEIVLPRVENVSSALAAAYLPGRFETIEADGKRIILDVAHNDDSLLAALATLADLSPREKNAVVLGMMRRKELVDFPSAALRRTKRLYLVEPVPGESHPTQELLAVLSPKRLKSSGVDVVVRDRAWEPKRGRELLRALLHPAAPCDTILITGSHRTVGLFGSLLGRMGLWQGRKSTSEST